MVTYKLPVSLENKIGDNQMLVCFTFIYLFIMFERQGRNVS